MSASSDAVARLTASVAAETSVADSAITLLGGLAQLIRDNAADPVALNALADSIDTETGKLKDAVTTNTPVTPVQAAAVKK